MGALRSAQDAGWHAPEFVTSGPLALPDFARILASDVAEGAPECAQAFPAGAKGDVGDGQVSIAQQRRGPLDAPREQVAVWWDAKGLLE